MIIWDAPNLNSLADSYHERAEKEGVSAEDAKAAIELAAKKAEGRTKKRSKMATLLRAPMALIRGDDGEEEKGPTMEERVEAYANTLINDYMAAAEAAARERVRCGHRAAATTSAAG